MHFLIKNNIHNTFVTQLLEDCSDVNSLQRLPESRFKIFSFLNCIKVTWNFFLESSAVSVPSSLSSSKKVKTFALFCQDSVISYSIKLITIIKPKGLLDFFFNNPIKCPIHLYIPVQDNNVQLFVWLAHTHNLCLHLCNSNLFNQNKS